MRLWKLFILLEGVKTLVRLCASGLNEQNSLMEFSCKVFGEERSVSTLVELLTFLVVSIRFKRCVCGNYSDIAEW